MSSDYPQLLGSIEKVATSSALSILDNFRTFVGSQT